MTERFPSGLQSQSQDFYAALARAEAKAAGPPPKRIDTRRHIRNPANGWTYPNPNYGKEIG